MTLSDPKTNLLDISGRTAIVTGASSGLGVTFADAFAATGANVDLAARRMDRLEALAEHLTAGGGSAMPVACDVSEPHQVAAMATQTLERFGCIDILVSNAGNAGPMPERLPHELFEETVRVNLLGTWYCCREIGAHMARPGERLYRQRVLGGRAGRPAVLPTGLSGDQGGGD